jgi:hypothetical protein
MSYVIIFIKIRIEDEVYQVPPPEKAVRGVPFPLKNNPRAYPVQKIILKIISFVKYVAVVFALIGKTGSYFQSPQMDISLG